MPVIVDAMGGDHAPREIVAGSLMAARELGCEIVLVGQEPAILASLPEGGWEDSSRGLPITIEHAPDAVGMDDPHPARSLRRLPGSSLRVAAGLVKRHPGSALVSAGHTGAVMAAALMDLGRVPGIERPGIAAVIPTLSGPVVVIDVGANVDCKPSHLLRFAEMGLAYAHHILGIESPAVGLLNIGSESSKGNELARETFALLVDSGLPFAGNVEPDHLYEGRVPVVVTDGFAGNIFLKTSEGVAHTLKAQLERIGGATGSGGPSPGAALAALSRFNPDNPEYSGAPLLGVDGACIIVHGASKAQTLKHAIALAGRFASSQTLESIRKSAGRQDGPR